MRQTLLLTAAIAMAALLPSNARAEDEEVVVTATRTSTATERLPARVEVIDREDIEAQSLTTLAEALGPQAVQGGGAGQQTSLFLRGANSKHVLALFDGVRLNDAASPNAAYDFGQDTLGGLDRVEVLRGPASTIYGTDAVGGVVNAIPRRGGDSSFAPFLEVQAGSFDTRRGLAGAAGSVGGWDYGVSAEMFETDGFDQIPDRMSTEVGEADGASIETFIASVRRDVGIFGFDALVRVRKSEVEYDTFSGGPGFDLRADDHDLENEAEQALWRLGADLETGALDLHASGGQVTSERSETDGGFQTSAADSERAFADVLASYRLGVGLLTAGLSFEHNAIDTLPQFADPLSAEEDQVAAYLIGQFDIGEHVVATGSARVDDYENFGTHTTYALGVVADFTPVRVFASYATAFKAPSLSERFETSFFNIGNPDLEPEDSRSWEIGADWRIGDRLTIGGSYYQTRIDNLIEYRFALLQNVNVNEAEIDGAEAYVEASPTSWSQLRLTYVWTDTLDVALNQQLARRPLHSWQVDARITPTERLALTLSWTYVGDRTDVTYNDDGTFASSFGTANAFNVGALSATFDLNERAQFFARIDNVTDETYEQPNAFASAPRSGFLGVRARF